MRRYSVKELPIWCVSLGRCNRGLEEDGTRAQVIRGSHRGVESHRGLEERWDLNSLFDGDLSRRDPEMRPRKGHKPSGSCWSISLLETGSARRVDTCGWYQKLTEPGWVALANASSPAMIPII